MGAVMLANEDADNPLEYPLGGMSIHARVPLHAIVLNEILALAETQ
jgi:hypothetical protein